MAGVIDREKTLDKLLGMTRGETEYHQYILSKALHLVAIEPTVDAVPVVRCKDCKYGIWDEDDQMWECIVEVDLTGDPDIYSMFHEYNDGMHFCSYGERRTDV